jgi:hypothetical protein
MSGGEKLSGGFTAYDRWKDCIIAKFLIEHWEIHVRAKV